jgi:LmbE family N-acetylglucosaminyl deacetylase
MKKLIRRALRAAVITGLRWRSRPLPLNQGGPCVIIAPHPDDEALGCAGLILTRRRAGLPVKIIYVTDGAGSHPNHPRLPPADLARTRRQEAIQAMHLLQVPLPDLQFLDAADGTLGHLSPAELTSLARRIAAALAQVGPGEVFLPCADDGSSEHQAAFKLTRQALALANLRPRLFEYPIWARWSPQRLVRPGLNSRVWRVSFQELAAVKRAALACYQSQSKPTEPWPDAVLPAGFIACFESPEEFFLERPDPC